MKLAHITLSDGEIIPCVLRDVSASGARIAVARRHRLPEFFHLSVDGKDEICRVRRVWQRGDFAGITIRET